MPSRQQKPTLLWDDDRLVRPHEQADKSQRVRRMFDAIAPTYEVVNRLFSAGRDRAWRQESVALVRPTSQDRVLDIACGTGDFARAFGSSPAGSPLIVGCDFAPRMLSRAASRSGPDISWVQANALALPFESASFSITGCAFGVRNFQNLDTGLGEMFRVLRPGGRAVILEFSMPGHRLWRRVYGLYACRIMPLGAALVSRDRTGAYRYLPRSVVSFSTKAEMCDRLKLAGFEKVTATPMTFGIVTVYVAAKGFDG